MWTVLAIFCLLASFDVNAARSTREELSSLEKSSPSVMELRRLEDTPIRHPRKLSGNSRTTRLHIENQHGFDGKVEKIQINSEEDLPGIRAYGLQRKHRLNNGHIERKIKAEALKEDNDASRIARSAILAASSQGYVLNVHDGHSTDEQSSDQVQVMGQDRMDSTIQQKESTLDSVGLTIDKKYETSRNSRSTDSDLTTTLIDVYFANFDNIKALKIAFLKIVSTNVHFLIDEIEKNDVTSALDLPFVDFIMEMALPMLSGNNGHGNEFGGKKGLFSDPLNIGGNLLQDKSDTPAVDVIDTENFTSMDMDPVFEEPQTSATQSSVRKFLPV